MAYALKLSLPFEVNFEDLARRHAGDQTKLGHYHEEPENVPPPVAAWLSELGIDITHCEVFYTPPYARLPIHVDGPRMSNIVKLNWCYGAQGSVMNWFRLKDETIDPPHKITVIGTNYIQPLPEQCRMVHSARIGTPTLVNVGQPHSVINPTSEGRWVYSVVLARFGMPLQWDSAYEIFKGSRSR